MSEQKFLSYGRQVIDEDDIQAVADVLRSDFLTTGPQVQKFEEKLRSITTAKHVIACSNGTTALHLACLAIGISEGDAVIVPSATFLATANAVRYCGGTVIFSDVDSVTGLMTASNLEEALTRCGDLTPKAVMPVHLTGQCVDLRSLKDVAQKHDLKIIADGSHAIGGVLHEHPVGAGVYEDLTTFSFHPVKTIAMGEGGAVATNNPEYAHKLATLRHHGMEPTPDVGPWAYEMKELGYNYRVTDIQCALGLSQIKKLDTFVKRRQEIVDLYNELLKGVVGVTCPKSTDYCNPAWHLYVVQIDFNDIGLTRSHVMNALKDQGIGTQVHYIPVHYQPYYQALYGDIELKGVDAYYSKILSLPLYPSLENIDIHRVVDALKTIMAKAG